MKTLDQVVTREYTVHLHKHLHGCTFKKRAPKAVKVLKQFAQKQMQTKDVRLDPDLNKHLWSRGIKSVPHRVRVRLERKRNNDEDGDLLFTHVSVVPVSSFKGLQTIVIDE